MRIMTQEMSDACRRKLPVGDPLRLEAGQVGPFTPDPVKVEKHNDKLERHIQAEICAYLRLHGIWHDVARFGVKSTVTAGRPDILLAYNGALAFEVKRVGEQATDEQRRCHLEMIKSGWCVYVVHGVEEVKAILEERAIDLDEI